MVFRTFGFRPSGGVAVLVGGCWGWAWGRVVGVRGLWSASRGGVLGCVWSFGGLWGWGVVFLGGSCGWRGRGGSGGGVGGSAGGLGFLKFDLLHGASGAIFYCFPFNSFVTVGCGIIKLDYSLVVFNFILFFFFFRGYQCDG